MNQTTEKIVWVLIVVILASAVGVIFYKYEVQILNMISKIVDYSILKSFDKTIDKVKGDGIIVFVKSIFEHIRKVH